jgi:hypothetical protein
VHGQRLSTRGNTSINSNVPRDLNFTPCSRSEEHRKQPDFHQKLQISPPNAATQGDTRRAFTSYASNLTASQIIDLLPENTLDEVLSLIDMDEADQQNHTDAVLADLTSTITFSSNADQIQAMPSSSSSTLCPVTTTTGNIARPWQNPRSIEDIATQLYHTRYTSIDDIIHDCKLGQVTSRERDLLNVM